jgi:peptide/nickel transport system ATP-binding protein
MPTSIQTAERFTYSDRGGKAQPLLIVDKMKKYFPVRGGLLNMVVGSVKAVDSVSFDVRKQEVLGVVGESGCGKSTTARLIIQLIVPDSGTLIFDGDAIGAAGGIAVSDLRRQAQMVFQDSYASLNPRLTVADSISYAPRMHGAPAAEAKERTETLLTEVGLNPAQFAQRYPHELSGGQRQRVNIARALALRPRLLILDEAVSALDKSVEAQVLNLLAELKEKFDLTYIFISHDLNVVEYISDRIVVMYLGRIVETGPVDEIYKHAQHPYTRALLRSKPSFDPRKRTTEMPLIGDPPSPLNPPLGCRFRTRCAFAERICEIETPELAAAPDSAPLHQVACQMFRTASGHSRAPRAS